MRLARCLQNYPGFLEKVYQFTVACFRLFDPLIHRIGYRNIERWLRPGEELAKQIIFDCRRRGQCVLHATGMTCPMTCPKKLRNGPCGGVQANGNCEVYPDKPCIWVQAFQRSRDMPTYGPEMMKLNPPVNYELEGDSAWINMLAGTDTEVPKGWIGLSDIVLLPEGSYPQNGQ